MLDNMFRKKKYVIIDASHGGRDSGLVTDNIKEKDLTLMISKYIYDKLRLSGINVAMVRDNDITITDTDRVNKILNIFGDDSDVVLISNYVNSSDGNAQIVYALRNNNLLSNLVYDNLVSAGLNVLEPYQRRLEDDTSLDYYFIHRNTGDIETLLINYGNVSNFEDINLNYKNYADGVVNAILSYLGGTVSNNNYYVVKAGDTLYSIARMFNTTVDNIKRNNNLSSNFITIGQRLNINNNVSTSDDNLYVVKKGDTLYSISRDYNVSVNDIKNLNNLSDNLLSIGQVLKLPNTSSDNSNITYIVSAGDNLYSIARKYGVSVSDIMEYNNLKSNLLSIGQVLKIPSNSNVYIVKSGDTLYSIARRYNVSVNDIKEKNNLSSNVLSIGQSLII